MKQSLPERRKSPRAAAPKRPRAAASRPLGAIYIEQATIDPYGILSVGGWALAKHAIKTLTVFADETPVGHAYLDVERMDVATAHPEYPNAAKSGFRLQQALAFPDQTVTVARVEMMCEGGRVYEETRSIERVGLRSQPAPHLNPLKRDPSDLVKTDFSIEEATPPGSELATATAALADDLALEVAADLTGPQPSSAICMFCDIATVAGDGWLEVSGWAVCAIGISQIRVMIDESDVGLATYGHPRPDVAATFPDIKHATLSGFRFRQHSAQSFSGEHEVRIVVRNLAREEKEERLQATATLVTPPVPPATTAQAEASTVTAEQVMEFKFQLDSPALANGVVPEMVTGRLTIEGWLLSRSGIQTFQVFMDEQLLGDAHYGLVRQDVGAAFPDWPNAGRSGFAFHCPPRALKNGDHKIRLAAEAKNGTTISQEFNLTVNKSEETWEQTGIRRRLPRLESDMMLSLLADLGYAPSISCLFCYHAEPAKDGSQITIDQASLAVTLNALRMQAYDNWSAQVVTGTPEEATNIRRALEAVAPDLAGRFTVASAAAKVAEEKFGPAPLTDGTHGRLALHIPLSFGDELGADAFLELAVAMARNPSANIVYSDELKVSPVSGSLEPFFKPDWSPDLLTATHYWGRLWAVTDETLSATAVSAETFFQNGEYDLALRCAEKASVVRHIPKLLCQTAPTETSKLRRAVVQEQTALRQMLDRRGIVATVESTAIPGTWRIRRAVETAAKISIIIPTCGAGEFIENCLRALRAQTRYENYEIIVIDNIPTAQTTRKAWLRENADHVIDMPDEFNWSIFNNRAAAVAGGEFLLFLNDDITVTQSDWLQAMMEHAQRPEVGIVGPRLLYPDATVQHAGMFLAQSGIARHAFRFAPHDDPCYFGLALTQRNVTAVTGACMLVRRATFEALGGFDSAHKIVNNDLDYCLRSQLSGLLTVFTPYASLTHHELASRSGLKDVFDPERFDARWKTMFAAGDPFFNPRLWRHADDWHADEEPVQTVMSASPLFHHSEIKRILVVKLDHIGDFVTALPPIRRLKSFFPSAKITVLAAPASRALADLEPAIDAFIPFAFFHARSELGERQLEKADFVELEQQLRSQRFDLAVDFRKHPSTRDVLKHTGARFLAGFDYEGQYPHLDIALDWNGDHALQRKRSHIVTDLMALANAIGQAAETDSSLISALPAPMDRSALPDDVETLFDKPVVAIHPGAGNITKQWPETHFAALIDLLIERNGVNVLLIGGSEEAGIAQRVQQSVLHAGSMASMVGRTSLPSLTALLSLCALYIGNDSGPKHIAAAVGIPTIGIHSGVVDPVEWGPVGANAVALRRNMTCSPCYLAKAEDCPRALACLRQLEPNLVYETANLLLARLAGQQSAVQTARRTNSQSDKTTIDSRADAIGGPDRPKTAAHRPYRKPMRRARRTTETS